MPLHIKIENYPQVLVICNLFDILFMDFNFNFSWYTIAIISYRHVNRFIRI